MGAQVDVFGKATVLKQADLKTSEWNKFYSSFLTEVSLIVETNSLLIAVDEEHFY